MQPSQASDENDPVSIKDNDLTRFGEDESMAEESPVEIEKPKLKLKKEIGLLSGISFVVGTIIGSGIFITPQGVLRNTGSVGLCMTVWASGVILAMLGALTFTELMSVVRKSGGEYAVLFRTFGPIPAFLFVWAKQIASDPASRAVQTLTFAEYLSTFLNNCGSPDVPKRLVAVVVIILLSITNSYSVRLTARIQILFTVAKVLALVVIMIGGLIKIGQGTVSELPSGFEGSVTSPSRIALAYYSVMYSYTGWNSVNYLIEEVKNPRRNGPLSSIIGVLVVGVVYILTNISYLAVMSKQELLQSPAVAQTWGVKVIDPAAWIMTVAVMMSVFGSANGAIATGCRIQFAAARDENWWGFLSFLNVKRYTPMPVIIVHATIACIMVIQGTVTTLINFLSFSLWLFYGACAICCIILRFKIKDDPKRIKVPIIIPIIFLLCCLFMIIAPIVQNPRIELLYAAIFIVGGLLLYFPLIYLDIKPKFIDTFEMYLQLLLEVAPSRYDPDDY